MNLIVVKIKIVVILTAMSLAHTHNKQLPYSECNKDHCDAASGGHNCQRTVHSHIKTERAVGSYRLS